MTTYDKTQIYEERIKEHVKMILLLCDEYKIPAFMTFAVGNDEKGTSYVSEMMSAEVVGQHLTDDKLIDHALVMSGFKAVVESKVPQYIETLAVQED